MIVHQNGIHKDGQVARFDFTSPRDFGTPYIAQPKKKEVKVEEEKAKASPPPPPPKTFSEAEVEAAKKAAYEEGLAAGKQQGYQQAQSEEQATQQALEKHTAALAQNITTLQNEWKALVDSQQAALRELACGIAKQVCESLLEDQPTALFEDLAKRCLPLLMQQPHITISAHPELTESIRPILRRLCENSGYYGEVEVKKDGSLGKHDARITWQQGSAEISELAIWQAVEVALNLEDKQEYSVEGVKQAQPKELSEEELNVIEQDIMKRVEETLPAGDSDKSANA
jgi:flagellar assembly protein FliH